MFESRRNSVISKKQTKETKPNQKKKTENKKKIVERTKGKKIKKKFKNCLKIAVKIYQITDK